MRANRASGSEPERNLSRALWHAGFRGYRLNWADAPGRPDIAYPGRRIAVFVHGCFWHRCPACALALPRANRDFWKRKFAANRSRDRRKRRLLEAEGWRVFEIWECWIRENPGRVPGQVTRALRSRPRSPDSSSRLPRRTLGSARTTS
ncbi:MAG: very short patch repair endonuclease [Gemmatimonadetes bacterium]|nr:very short patch repair endonuclease [Gemmatimonadota bacterium]